MPRQHELSKQPQRRHQPSPQYIGKGAATKLARLSTCLALAFLSSASGVSAQQSTPFTDAATGIQFQRFFGARTNFGFGFALPPAGGAGFPTGAAAGATTGANGRNRGRQNQNQKRQNAGGAESFIGQLTFPLVNGAGWGGFSLTGDMEGPLLMAAWSDGKGNVVSSFRQAFNEDDDPPEVTGSFSLRPIATATSVNNTFLTYTFLCENCLDASLGFGSGAENTEMGWALASRAVRNPETSAGVLGFHNSGFGDFSANVGAARNALFATWAALADPAPVAASRGARAFDTQAGLDGGDSDSDDDGGLGGGGGGGGGFDGDGDDSGDDSDSDSD